MHRSPLLAVGKPRPAVPNPDLTHHEVALYLLKLFPYFPLAAGEPSGRKPAGATLPVPLPYFWPAKGRIARPQIIPGSPVQVSRGLFAKFFFLFFFKNSELANSVTNCRKIIK